MRNNLWNVIHDYLKKLEVVISQSVWHGRFQCTHQQALWIELSLFETKCKAHPRFSFFRFFCNLALSYLHSATKIKTFKMPRNNICGKIFKTMYQLPRNLANLNICRFSMLDMLRDKNCTIWPRKCHIKHLPTVHKRLPYLNTVLK